MPQNSCRHCGAKVSHRGRAQTKAIYYACGSVSLLGYQDTQTTRCKAGELDRVRGIVANIRERWREMRLGAHKGDAIDLYSDVDYITDAIEDILSPQ